MTPARKYRWLAEYYDLLFTHHLDWFEAARDEILTPILSGVRSGCDLACGTGTTAMTLAVAGVRMYGVDVSPVMCRLAREKARRAGLPVRILRADMRDFLLPEPVDLVLCEFDALNHVPNKDDLGRVLRCVAAALKPGGYFYFDVNNRQSFKRIWSNTWFLEKTGVALVMHGGYDRARDTAYSDLEWFIRDGKHWVRKHERFEQVCWSGAEIRRGLRAAGFGRAQAWDATPFFQQDTLVAPGDRTFFLARRATSSRRTS